MLGHRPIPVALSLPQPPPLLGFHDRLLAGWLARTGPLVRDGPAAHSRHSVGGEGESDSDAPAARAFANYEKVGAFGWRCGAAWRGAAQAGESAYSPTTCATCNLSHVIRRRHKKANAKEKNKRTNERTKRNETIRVFLENRKNWTNNAETAYAIDARSSFTGGGRPRVLRRQRRLSNGNRERSPGSKDVAQRRNYFPSRRTKRAQF